MLVGEDHQPDPVAQAELPEDPGDVGLDRRLADELVLGDLAVAEPRAARSKISRSRGVRSLTAAGDVRGPLGGVVVPAEEFAGRRRREDRRARVHGADRCEQELGVGVLEHEAARTRRGWPWQRPRRSRTSSARGPWRRRDPALAPTMRAVAVMPSITGIRTSMSTDVRVGAADELHALGAVARLTHECEVRLGVDEHPDAGAEQRLVVDEGDADGGSVMARCAPGRSR